MIRGMSLMLLLLLLLLRGCGDDCDGDTCCVDHIAVDDVIVATKM